MFLTRRGKHRRTRAAGRSWDEAVGGAFIVDRAGNVLGFDERMERLTGWPAVEVVGRHKDRHRPLALGTTGRASSGALYDGAIAVPGSSTRIELRLRCRDRNALDVEAVAEPLPGRVGRVSVRVRRVLAFGGEPVRRGRPDGYDALTGLHDHETFAQHLEAAFRAATDRNRPLALILANVDHLRRINDQMGRPAGDRVLTELAGILNDSVDGAAIARVGDDDFAVLLPDAGRGDARQTAARLRREVERHRFFGDAEHAPAVTLSLGAASYPADGESGEDLMRRAHEALDEARMLGRNRVWCYTRRPRVPLEVPVYFDSAEPSLAGFSHDLSPSGLFVHTAVPVEAGMRCALAFPLPNQRGKVHVVGRVVRTVPDADAPRPDGQVPGMGFEFERFGHSDRRAIETFLHANEATTRRPEAAAAPIV